MTRTLLHTRRGRLALIAGGLALVIGLVVWQAPDLGPISRARIHEITGIRPSATSQIVRHLLHEGRVHIYD